MALQQYEKVLFQRNPLKLVVGQIQFPLLPRVGEQGYVAAFLDGLRNDYPRSGREQQVSLQISSGGVSQNVGDSQWRLSTIDLNWSVVLSSNALTIEVREFTSIDELIGRFQRMLNVATEAFPITERLRLGFRFVNEIRVSGAETLSQWQEYLRPEFLGFAASDVFRDEGRVSHTLQQVQMERTDGTLTVRHGLLNGAVVAPLQGQPDTGPFYMIDLDYYDAQAIPLDIPSTMEQVRSFNDVLYNIFRWTLMPSLYEKLEPTHAG